MKHIYFGSKFISGFEMFTSDQDPIKPYKHWLTQTITILMFSPVLVKAAEEPILDLSPWINYRIGPGWLEKINSLVWGKIPLSSGKKRCLASSVVDPGIHKFLGFPDPDSDPSIISKKVRKTLIYFPLFYFFIFEDQCKFTSKSNKQKNLVSWKPLTKRAESGAGFGSVSGSVPKCYVCYGSTTLLTRPFGLLNRSKQCCGQAAGSSRICIILPDPDQHPGHADPFLADPD